MDRRSKEPRSVQVVALTEPEALQRADDLGVDDGQVVPLRPSKPADKPGEPGGQAAIAVLLIVAAAALYVLGLVQWSQSYADDTETVLQQIHYTLEGIGLWIAASAALISGVVVACRRGR